MSQSSYKFEVPWTSKYLQLIQDYIYFAQNVHLGEAVLSCSGSRGSAASSRGSGCTCCRRRMLAKMPLNREPLCCRGQSTFLKRSLPSLLAIQSEDAQPSPAVSRSTHLLDIRLELAAEPAHGMRRHARLIRRSSFAGVLRPIQKHTLKAGS